MPYIPEDERDLFYARGRVANKPGQLNYQITELLIEYVQQHGVNYDTLNACGGALDYCGKEFYRRVVVPFEQRKIEQNGDVYPGELL